MRRGVLPSGAMPATASCCMPPASATSIARGCPSSVDSPTDSSSPRASARLRALMRLSRSDSIRLRARQPLRPRAAALRRARAPARRASATRRTARMPWSASTARATAAARRATSIAGCSSAHSPLPRCDIDGARQVLMQQRVAHRDAHIARHVALRLDRVGAEVRREDDVSRTAQRVVGRQRLRARTRRAPRRAARLPRAPRPAPLRPRCRRAPC